MNSELDAAHVTVTGSNFDDNSNILCRGTLSASLLQLKISFSKFLNNSNSVVVSYFLNVTYIYRTKVFLVTTVLL